ncbi:MAG: 16S rRNA (cytosine(1402)-N(4))-methyltransferase RsmH [Candidatus Hydrogenedentes bacterium]|nr:16S rRNA (cytosine(1402)-N(4))-methyltransferase RsmH [Candidatus Hydrogenedentota bacterium]
MTSSPQIHVPVMAEEAISLLQIRPDGVYVDATAGAGGHSERIAGLLAGGRLIALDRDPGAVALSRQRLSGFPWVKVIKANYSELQAVLAGLDITSVDGVLLDAGVSSMQIDMAERGFSLQSDGPLDMRMDTTEERDAAAWLARSDCGEIERVLREYGDVGPAGRIARVIAARCKANQMRRTSDLAAAVREALDFLASDPDEIRTVFQAVRIAVNEELKHLELGLRQAAWSLAAGGRLVAISFHSGEDRVVKRVFQELTRPATLLYPDGRVREKTLPAFRSVTAKPLTPAPGEMRDNPRSKSAKMRAIERAV